MKAIFIISSLKLRLIIATADGENKVACCEMVLPI